MSGIDDITMKMFPLAFLLISAIWSSAILTASAQTKPTNGLPKLSKRYFDSVVDPSCWRLTNKVNKVKVNFMIGEETPAKIAYRFGKDNPPNYNLDGPDWKLLDPSKREVILDLGSAEGEFYFWIAAEWENPHEGSAGLYKAFVDRSPPIIVITYPTNRITSQPWLQLLGYANEQLFGIHYDVVNSSGTSANHDGFAADRQNWDEKKFDWTRFCFQCYDISLTLGTNEIVLRCSDTAGNEVTTNIEVVFTTAGDTNPPVITPRWPTNGMEMNGSAFTARGSIDDYTATLKGIISGGGQTNEIMGLVERNGTFWVENIPILAETNELNLIATDAAGNSSKTNLTIYKSDVELVIESTPTGDDLYKPSGIVTGRVTPGYEVYVNGAKAVVDPNGHWRVEKTPIYGMGTATFDATAVPIETALAAKNPSTGIKSLLSSTASLGQEPIVLNPNQPACGRFSLHLTGTSGKNFILMASTNLVNWTPVLTNFDSSASFDFTDSNTANYTCRFFRVVPLQ
jgi:hypothetical protein